VAAPPQDEESAVVRIRDENSSDEPRRHRFTLPPGRRLTGLSQSPSKRSQSVGAINPAHKLGQSAAEAERCASIFRGANARWSVFTTSPRPGHGPLTRMLPLSPGYPGFPRIDRTQPIRKKRLTGQDPALTSSPSSRYRTFGAIGSGMSPGPVATPSDAKDLHLSRRSGRRL
jgi:hypothetical protein